jgi:MAF protein
MDTKLLLASGSPRRRELIALLGLPFEIVSASIDETPRDGEDPAAMVLRLSLEKAIDVRDQTDVEAIVVAADTTVALDGEVLGKPRDAREAREMLTRLRGRAHAVYTAITLIEGISGRRISDLGETAVPMRNYDDDEIEAYIVSGDPFDKAGAYAIQNRDFDPVENMRGCFANVVGMPLCHVVRSLRRLGVEPQADVPAACQAHFQYACPVFQSILDGG